VTVWYGTENGQAPSGGIEDEGAEFRTGIRSLVKLSIPPDQTIIIDRATTVKLLIAKRQGAEVRTSLGMPYGRTEYQVEEAGVERRIQRGPRNAG